ncbi:aminotransferase class I/II-fold pyridoxal phosphate-dependent enzyme [Carboxylicivirga sp. A043]|uniref:methionine aminotransferase n=1 Tax=Carboxylicivirga litoralis TaxID=2816963 RepID=UPI0021CB050E|nr:methionine aminotransferase [Carboxylicivirga sp. A043]MCU4155873.1 aminotransferase class I/II-fold pyridoxal phosphate-dependent enzyme [Carboxylicivirga sp. A043]
MKINSKFHNLEPSFLTTLKPLIKEFNAIDLASGHTGFHCSPKLISLVEKHLREGLNNYADAAGEMMLRTKMAAKINALYDRQYNPETEITITAGAAQGIYTAIAALVKEGDEVIVFEPANEYYAPAIEINGGQVRTIPMSGKEYHIEWELVQQMISNKTRMIIINSPHAPTGWAMGEIDMLRLQKIINGSKIIVLSEETFEHVLFDGHLHQSIACFPKLAERSVIVSSIGETYHVTGFQIGYCAAPEAIMREFRQVHEAMMYSVNSPFQLAIADFLDEKEEYKKLNAFYQNKRDKFLNLLEGSRFKALKSSGSFFQLLDYSQISEEKDRDLVVRLIKEHGIAVMPISAFISERQQRHHIRINFAKPDEVLEEAAKRLKEV